MNEEQAITFWTKRNEMLAKIQAKCPQGWKNHPEFCLGLSILATEGLCARETSKVAAGLRHTIRELEVVSKKIEKQMQELSSNNIFAKSDGIDWDLLKDYFSMDTKGIALLKAVKESENDGEETDA